MKTHDLTIEAKILKTVCDSPPEIRSKLLSLINHDLFGGSESVEIYQRMTVLIRSGKDIPTTEIFKYDEVISEESRNLLAGPGIFHQWNDIQAALDLLEKYRKARFLYAGIKSATSILKEQEADPTQAIQALEQCLFAAKQTSDDSQLLHISVNADNKADELIDQILTAEAPDYIPTGFTEFDARSGGVKRKSVVALASVSGGGKSIMANQLAMSQFMLGFNVCKVSYEMDEEEEMTRLLSAVSYIDHSKINLKKMMPQDKKYIRKKWFEFIEKSGVRGNRLTIYCPTKEKNINELCAELKPFGYDAIYFDYINLLKPLDPKKQMWEHLGETSRAAKLNSNSMNSALVLLCQLDDESNKIKYAKSIIHNSHLVWTWQSTDKEKETGIVQIHIAKARSGEVYDFYLKRDFSVMRFCDYDGPPPVQEQPEQKASKVPTMDELMGKQ